MIIGLARALLKKEDLNSGDWLHIIEILVVGMGLIFGIIHNAKEVPGLKDAVASIDKRVTAVETSQSDMKDTLEHVSATVDRIEGVLMDRRSSK